MEARPTCAVDRQPSGRSGHISSIVELLSEANPEIQAFTVVEYIDPPLIQDRLPWIEDTEVFKGALALRDQTSLPFWDSALAQALNGVADVKSILREALFHNAYQDVERRIPSKDAASEIRALVSRDWIGSTLALASKVLITGERERHIPMLDFHIPSDQRNYDTVATCLSELAIGKFVIIDSGKSFHAYGLSLLDREELKCFLSRALLLSPIVDSRYVAHQLLDSQCKLRIAPTPRKPTHPRILGTI